jgi:hypothetical protein
VLDVLLVGLGRASHVVIGWLLRWSMRRVRVKLELENELVMMIAIMAVKVVQVVQVGGVVSEGSGVEVQV